MRRIIAVLGTLALAATVVPNGRDVASEAFDCCNGIMCPMHAAQTHAPNCDMDGKGSSAALKPCPVPMAVHYTATIVFVLRAPVILHHEVLSGPAPTITRNFYSDAARPVDSPPPRLPLTA